MKKTIFSLTHTKKTQKTKPFLENKLNKLFMLKSLFYSILTNLKVHDANLDIMTILIFLKEI